MARGSTTNRRPVTAAEIPPGRATPAAAAVDAAATAPSPPAVQVNPLDGPLPTARQPNARSAPPVPPVAVRDPVYFSFAANGTQGFVAAGAATYTTAATDGTGGGTFSYALNGGSESLPIAVVAGDLLEVSLAGASGTIQRYLTLTEAS